MLLAQQYAPDLSKVKDNIMISTPLGYILRGDMAGFKQDFIDRNSTPVTLTNEDLMNMSMDLVTPMAKVGGIVGSIGKNAFKPFTQSRFLENTPKNPDPRVGTRYERTDLGLLVPHKNLTDDDLYNSIIIPKQSDLTSRGQRIESVSDMPLKEPVITTGGFDYPRDKGLKGVVYASNEQAAQKDINRMLNAKKYYESQDIPVNNIFLAPSTMADGSEYFSDMTAKTFLNFIDNGRISKQLVNDLDEEIRRFNPKKKKDGSVSFPTADWKGIMTPEGREQLNSINGAKYRKALAKRMEVQKYGKEMGFNYEDIRGAVLADRLKGLEANMFGDTLIKVNPNKLKLAEGSHPAYSHDVLGAEGVYTLGNNYPVKGVLYGDDYFEALKRGELTTQVKKGKTIPADDISKTKQADKNTFGRLYDGTSGILGGYVDDATLERMKAFKKFQGLL